MRDCGSTQHRSGHRRSGLFPYFRSKPGGTATARRPGFDQQAQAGGEPGLAYTPGKKLQRGYHLLGHRTIRHRSAKLQEEAASHAMTSDESQNRAMLGRSRKNREAGSTTTARSSHWLPGRRWGTIAADWTLWRSRWCSDNGSGWSSSLEGGEVPLPSRSIPCMETAHVVRSTERVGSSAEGRPSRIRDCPGRTVRDGRRATFPATAFFAPFLLTPVLNSCRISCRQTATLSSKSYSRPLSFSVPHPACDVDFLCNFPYSVMILQGPVLL